MEKLKINRFNTRAEVRYFVIEPRLALVFGVVDETEEELLYYNVCMAPFWNEFQNTTVYELALNPTGERYYTGEPASMKRSDLGDGIFANKLDITTDIDEVRFILTGKRKSAVLTNVIG